MYVRTAIQVSVAVIITTSSIQLTDFHQLDSEDL